MFQKVRFFFKFKNKTAYTLEYKHKIMIITLFHEKKILRYNFVIHDKQGGAEFSVVPKQYTGNNSYQRQK